MILGYLSRLQVQLHISLLGETQKCHRKDVMMEAKSSGVERMRGVGRRSEDAVLLALKMK